MRKGGPYNLVIPRRCFAAQDLCSPVGRRRQIEESEIRHMARPQNVPRKRESVHCPVALLSIQTSQVTGPAASSLIGSPANLSASLICPW